MPPHTRTVLKYHSGKLPLRHASTKLTMPKGPDGVSAAMSAGTPGRNDATAIHRNGTAHSTAAAPAMTSTSARLSALIMNAALEGAEREEGQRQQRADADHGGRGGEAGVVVLRRLLIDVIEQEVGG